MTANHDTIFGYNTLATIIILWSSVTMTEVCVFYKHFFSHFVKVQEVYFYIHFVCCTVFLVEGHPHHRPRTTLYYYCCWSPEFEAQVLYYHKINVICWHRGCGSTSAVENAFFHCRRQTQKNKCRLGSCFIVFLNVLSVICFPIVPVG